MSKWHRTKITFNVTQTADIITWCLENCGHDWNTVNEYKVAEMHGKYCVMAKTTASKFEKALKRGEFANLPGVPDIVVGCFSFKRKSDAMAFKLAWV